MYQLLLLFIILLIQISFNFDNYPLPIVLYSFIYLNSFKSYYFYLYLYYYYYYYCFQIPSIQSYLMFLFYFFLIFNYSSNQYHTHFIFNFNFNNYLYDLNYLNIILNYCYYSQYSLFYLCRYQAMNSYVYIRFLYKINIIKFITIRKFTLTTNNILIPRKLSLKIILTITAQYNKMITRFYRRYWSGKLFLFLNENI